MSRYYKKRRIEKFQNVFMEVLEYENGVETRS